jgi:Tos1-like cell wall protein
MPSSGLPNKPAIWFLNAQIPRVGQYLTGTCWLSGCGELDTFEILSPNNTRLIATLHDSTGRGFSDYFERPVELYTKAAVLMYNDSVTIQILPSDFHIGTSISEAQIEQIQTDSEWESAPMAALKLASS